MEIKAQVLAEDCRVAAGVEYLSITCMETSPMTLLQMFDYGLRNEEKLHKGKLVGRTVTLRITNIRNIFAGRPQFAGTLELVPK